MRKIILLFLFIFSIFPLAHAQSSGIARGSVFHDINGNGKKDPREPGIPGVAVSNGVDVVKTDKDGTYVLNVSDDAILFVIKPGHFKYPVNDHNLPQYYYIHKPEGSPELNYQGIEPTGPLPERIDFGLLTGNDSDRFSIIVFSDPQPYSLEEVGYYDNGIVEELTGVQGYEFGITLGDLVGDRPDFFEPLNKATARIGMPWFHVLGNHDMNFDTSNPFHIDESFNGVYGPANFAFNQGKVHFIVLDNVIYPNTYNDKQYVGGFREDQFQFIENTLKHVPEDYLVVINMHIPLFNEFPHGETFKDSHRERVFDILKDRPYTLSMSGHTHTQRHHYFGDDAGWKQEQPHHHFNVGTASGDWWSGQRDENGIPKAEMRDGVPKGYNFIHFDGNQYKYDYKVAGMPSSYKMRIYGPRLVPQNFRFRGEFYVNFFQGSENCLVEYKINGGEWLPMNYTLEQDPYIASLRYEWDNADVMPQGVRPSNPVLSYHLWKMRVPTSLPLGSNILYVKVTDKFGRIFTDQIEFKVVEV